MTHAVTPPGGPGISPRWTSSDKTAVGRAAGSAGRVWFTVSHGILNEVYAPRLDQASIRDFGFIVTAKDYFSEEKRDADHVVETIEDGVPAFRLINTSKDGRYRITKTILSDPDREVVLQDVRFEALIGSIKDYQLHAIISPHLINGGANNTGWYDDFKGSPMLLATGTGRSLAVASSAAWLSRSAGFVGTSDAWQTLSRGEGVRGEYQRAEDGNIALAGTIDLPDNGHTLLTLGFGTQPEEAAFRALLSLQQGVGNALQVYRAGWRRWQKNLLPLDEPHEPNTLNRYRVSTSVLATHRDDGSGAIIASLSIPWGSTKGDDDLGGYHLVWTRDLVETAGGLLAAGATDDALAVLGYLVATQESDGHWVQNSWLDGRAYWHGIQMDETAFPILLYDMLKRENVIGLGDARRYDAMILAASSYIVRNGPATQQDRWEEDGGFSPFTLAVEIAALLAAADAVEAAGKTSTAAYLRQVADSWNEQVESWTYATGTDLAKELGVDGYYMRIGSFTGEGHSRSPAMVAVKNRSDTGLMLDAGLLVSPDALALVRFGLRAADDPRIANTVRAIDTLLRRDLPAGPYWYRYNEDGYGEREDGSPFNGTGIGRLWPLLTGERAHFELAAGRPDEARRLLAALEASASPGGLLPEQIWDVADVPERELYQGRPSGSAMPLVWAHSEHIKLLRSLRDGTVFDMPPQTVERYLLNTPPVAPRVWRPGAAIDEIPVGRLLRFEFNEPAMVHWSNDGWKTTHDLDAIDTGIQTFIADVDTTPFAVGTVIQFAVFWPLRGNWQGQDFEIEVIA
ncbi:glucan 1,4-alpha-glucosidase [Rhizobium leguminosarum]|uniref:glucan 1,4-alpha-glucosidase n=1 Tax=Rhizobium leguminosarum TaxID=384 RepID=UPI00143F8EDB|nr:glucan 1,4-alpha-glucosidase [Rhizobium leguminosarum]NKL21772.1 glucan 1,4-alpha-glucosidase [Rhizobium leguminosarum bv. viciae]